MILLSGSRGHPSQAKARRAIAVQLDAKTVGEPITHVTDGRRDAVDWLPAQQMVSVRV